ncbi:MAG TPA: hypothetical protein VFK78_10090, partial [Gemmatimonadales bacterium]|nr:hypothetical protein [Gemmatimonadales bacterium]
RRLIARLARQAARLAVRASDAQPGEPLVPLPALDPDQETDAGEVIALARRGGETILGVAFRIRFARGADTTLVSGVALTDARGASVRWLLAPVRGALQGGVVKSPGTRYVLRGSVARPGGGLPYLLVDQIADVAVSDARELALDPQGPALRAALPLALRCRAS